MNSYEGLFILPPDSPDVKKTQVEAIKGLVSKFEGKISKIIEWGKRPLGYLLKKNRDAEMIVMDLEFSPDKVNPFRRALELQESLLKYTITRKHEHSLDLSKKEKPATQSETKSDATSASIANAS